LKKNWKTFVKGTNVIIICGHHHKREGILGKTDKGLKSGYDSTLKFFKQELTEECESKCGECEICEQVYAWNEKQICIETFFLDTVQDENTEEYILDQSSINKIKEKFSILSSSESPFVLIFASCWSTYSPINTVLRACGLFSVLAMKKDRGEISNGEFYCLTADQKDVLDKVADCPYPPKDLILAGKLLTIYFAVKEISCHFSILMDFV
jgi:hypothetical protein